MARFSAASAVLVPVSPICWPTKARLPVQQAEGGLEHAAQGQHGLGAGERQGDGQRHEAAAAADKIGLSFEDLRHRVVGEGEDGPVMAQDGVAEPGQLAGRRRRTGCGSSERLALVMTSGSFIFSISSQVQRRVGEHEAQAVLPRRRQPEQFVVRFCLEQHDGGLAGSAAVLFSAALTRQCFWIMSMVAIRAKGLFSRPLKRRSRSSASRFPARQAR